MTIHRFRGAFSLLAATSVLALGFPSATTANAAGSAGVVDIDTGSLRGEVLDAASGLTVYRGIPFAAPPVGDQRWKAPQPVTKWSGVRGATEFGAICPQSPVLAMMTGESLP
ncbi:MAG: carboxylesterase family protein, partial [Acidobacteria bacterium]|nr:carboxylesterase family protein [Acidobacteriota bacterium]